MLKTNKQKIVKTKENTSERFRSIISYVQFYALPFFSGTLFVLILLLAVFPNLKTIFVTLDEVDSLRSEDEILEQRITRLETLRANASRTQQIVNRINQIVPTGQTDVVAFRQRVVNSSLEEFLELEKLSSGETILNSDVNTVPNFFIVEIPSIFNLNGDFLNFRNFLNNLYGGDDFFIVNEMSLAFSPNEAEPNLWIGKFELIKYQFFADEAFDASTTFSQVSESEEPNAAVVEFLETRFISEQ